MSKYSLKSVTRAVVVKPPRILLLGVEKVGKSTFASQAPNAVLIPVKLERGIDSLDVAKFPAVDIFEDLVEALESLLEGEHDFETVALDSASALEAVIWEKVCREKGWKSIEDPGYGKGYLEALYYWQEIMNLLDRLQEERHMASIVIGHVKVKKFDDPERQSYDTYAFDINDRVAAALVRWADFIGFANIGVDIAEEKQGFNKTKVKGVHTGDMNQLHTKKTPAHPGGGRGVFGRLPESIDLEWSAFQDAVAEVLAEEAKAKAAKKKVKK